MLACTSGFLRCVCGPYGIEKGVRRVGLAVGEADRLGAVRAEQCACA
jgi:hypothetical protein